HRRQRLRAREPALPQAQRPGRARGRRHRRPAQPRGEVDRIAKLRSPSAGFFTGGCLVKYLTLLLSLVASQALAQNFQHEISGSGSYSSLEQGGTKVKISAWN